MTKHAEKMLLKLEQISLSRQGRVLFDGIDLSLEKGAKVAVCGASGSGKSSLLKLFIGIMQPASGSVAVGDQTMSPTSVDAIRGQLAYIGQEPWLAADTVREALLLPFTFKAHRHGIPDEKQMLDLLQLLNLPSGIMSRRSGEVSGGEKQRIVIARAMLLGKKIFLADECTSALDPESKRAVMDFLFADGLTLLSVAHDPDWLQRCDRVLELQDGQLVEVNHG